MKKFRFVGDPSIDEHILEYGRVYHGILHVKEWEMSVEEAAYLYPEDWEEVTEQEISRILNKDQPASSMTKFEMAVFMALQGLTANPELLGNSHEDHAEKAIEQATQLFKQLENLKK